MFIWLKCSVFIFFDSKIDRQANILYEISRTRRGSSGVVPPIHQLTHTQPQEIGIADKGEEAEALKIEDETLEEEKSETELRLEEPRPESKASERKAHRLVVAVTISVWHRGTFVQTLL